LDAQREEIVRHSQDRIITTHVGSLVRPDRLEALLIEREKGSPIDHAEFNREIDSALDYIIDRQVGTGVDVGSDGEMARVSFMTYVPQRISGYSGVSKRNMPMDMIRFPKYAKMFAQRTWSDDRQRPKVWNAPMATGEIKYEDDLKDVRFEMATFKSALERRSGKFGFLETFATAATPGIVSTVMLRDEKNPFYPTDREYVLALARELKKEYDFIVSQGHVLQLDAPDLALERQLMFQGRPIKEFLDRVELHMEAINLAIADIPRDKVRLHVCWGNWDGPHTDDVDLGELLPILYQAKVGALGFPFANPRHQHETKTLKKQKLPSDMILMVGLVDVTTNYVEHPEVVADRILQWVDVVGDRERIIATHDCGYGTFAGYTFVAEDVVWAKFETVRDGARLASERLWGRKAA
jgi:5-methyltetrahydropteroyltriglutamate--homocysteine methyltransferase